MFWDCLFVQVKEKIADVLRHFDAFENKQDIYKVSAQKYIKFLKYIGITSIKL
jgi:hypothetical protein